MADQTAPDYRQTTEQPESTSGAALGLIVFASVMMMMAGGFQALTGLVAIFENEFYVETRNYLVKFDATTWGWIHLLLGLVVALAGFAVMSGKTWGRTVGIILAVLSALTNFAFLPYYPFWAMTIIALDIFIIWALAAHGRELAR